jgi:hypothetical protein
VSHNSSLCHTPAVHILFHRAVRVFPIPREGRFEYACSSKRIYNAQLLTLTRMRISSAPARCMLHVSAERDRLPVHKNKFIWKLHARIQSSYGTTINAIPYCSCVIAPRKSIRAIKSLEIFSTQLYRVLSKIKVFALVPSFFSLSCQLARVAGRCVNI